MIRRYSSAKVQRVKKAQCFHVFHKAHNLKAVGSNPTPATNFNSKKTPANTIPNEKHNEQFPGLICAHYEHL